MEFYGIMANPTYAKVLEGAKLAKENHVDVILAAGGGSVMDCCKALWIAAKYDGDIWEDIWAKPGVIDFEPIPLCVVVTVGGTGSEIPTSWRFISANRMNRMCRMILPRL